MRYLIYFIYHPLGRVDRYITVLLAALRPWFDVIHVVSNGPLARDGLEAADIVQERANSGFDVGAYADAMARIDPATFARIDELTLANYTFFGPVNSFAPILDWARAQDVDFWGLSAHGAVVPNPFTGTGRMDYHLNSHWISIRAPMLHSADFRRYWQDMPEIASYQDSVLHHESRFTTHFAARGYRHASWLEPDAAAYPAYDEAADHIARGLPILKRRLFFHEPVAYGDASGANPRRAMELAAAQGFAPDLVWESVIGTADPWVIYQNADLLYILADASSGAPATASAELQARITAPLDPRDCAAFAAAITVPIRLSLSGPGAAGLSAHLAGHPLILPPSSDTDPARAVLAARICPGALQGFAYGMAHLARDGAVVAGAQAHFATPHIGLGLPVIRSHGTLAEVDQPPGLRSNAGVVWARAGLAARFLAAWPAPDGLAKLAADAGFLTIVLTNTAELPRNFVKLEARYRALAQHLNASGPFENVARMAHLADWAEGRMEAAQEQANRAGFDAGFDQGFTDGWQQAEARLRGRGLLARVAQRFRRAA